ncbi:MAG TPA: hypothetical protein VFW71_08470 [Actinomycetota bacterium]|nr:hypothetical protein [Actinomycetota bacterium]
MLALAFLLAGAAPASAHTTGPQLISSFDRFSPQISGVSYSILSTGSAPYITVQVNGQHTFDIFGLQGEPFIRITAAGVQLNRNSPSDYLVTNPSKTVTLPATVNPVTSWEHVADQPAFHYYETRAEWPHIGQPQEAKALGRTATVYRFTIPASYDGTPVAIVGHVTWVPAPINLEVPLLFVPIGVVILLWIEPKAKPYVSRIAVGTAVVALLGVAVDAGRSVLTFSSQTGGLRAAPLAILPGLVLIAAVAVPRLSRGHRGAYATVLLFGLYMVTFGLVRLGLLTTSPSGAILWLHRAELGLGALTTAGGGMLLFLTSPVRAHATRRRRQPVSPPRPARDT